MTVVERRSRVREWFNRTGSESVGWILVVMGLFMLILPGPGLLALLGGVALLARHYLWAQLILEPLHKRAIESAKFGVATIPRILVSLVGIACVLTVGTIWFLSPEIPEFSILGVRFGPQLPAAGWVGAIGIWFSGALGLGLLVYSIVRWRRPGPQAGHDLPDAP